jgi:hypothetical protein
MKKQFTLFCMELIAVAPICLGQASPSKADKSATKDAAITESEESAWEAYQNKQTDAFKKYLATDYSGVYAEGVKNLNKDVADMEKSELRDYSLTDMKVVFPSADVAAITYKATLQGSSGGQDTSGTYNVASVWVKKGGKWLVVFHTDAKSQ